MVKFDYKPTGTGHHLICLEIKCANYQQVFYYKIESIKDKDHILVFIKYIVFKHVGILWLIQAKETTEF